MCGGGKVTELFIKSFEMVGGASQASRESSAFWAGLGGDLASHSSLAMHHPNPSMQLSERGGPPPPHSLPNLMGVGIALEDGGGGGECQGGRLHPRVGLGGRKEWSFKGLHLSASLCGYRAALMCLFAQERPLRENRK